MKSKKKHDRVLLVRWQSRSRRESIENPKILAYWHNGNRLSGNCIADGF
ncbi:hypothetical protein [Chamaesiphon minutus]|nr:hypothetical protein [Chamaesiphon minutus]